MTAGELLWWLWIAVLVRSVWLLADWRAEWFVTTDRRMLLVYGLVTRKVAMMPLGKVTDMNYKRSPLGLLLGYGEFVLESAGQDQAMRSIPYVRRPDDTYRAICAVIFAPQNAEQQHRAAPRTPEPPSFRPTWPPAPSVSASDDVTQAIPVRRPVPADPGDDVGPAGPSPRPRPGTSTSGPTGPTSPDSPARSGWRDSNPRPSAPKADALPTCATSRRTRSGPGAGGVHDAPSHTRYPGCRGPDCSRRARTSADVAQW